MPQQSTTSKHQFPGTPPKEALRWFASKSLKPSFDYRDVWREEHNQAFTVAKAMQLDVLSDIHSALVRNMQSGKTLPEFQQDLRPLLEKRGWWGKQEGVDPETGEVKTVQLGSPRRLKVIYQTNIKQARAAGREERAQRVKKRFPYAMYVIGPSENHRPEHVAWHGLVLPVDDPFWDTHTPTNGWGCKCSKRFITKFQYKQLKKTGIPNPVAENEYDSEGNRTGRKARKMMPIKTKSPALDFYKWENPRTGELMQVPGGIDPGFDYNPGKDRTAKQLQYVTSKLIGAKPKLARAATQQLVSGHSFKSWYQQPSGSFPIAVLPKAHADEIGASSHVVLISAETAKKQIKKHSEITAAEYLAVQQIIETGERVQDGANHLIYILDQAPGYTLIVKATKSGAGLYLQSLRRLSKQQAKRDEELKRLRKKGGD